MSCSWRAARTLADQAITDATERSISPAMMTNVIVTTTMTFSMCSWNRLTKLSTLRYPLDSLRLKAIVPSRMTPSTSSHV